MVSAYIGTSPDLLKQRQTLTKDFIKTNGDQSVQQIDCEEASLPQVMSDLASPSFLSPHRLFILKRLSCNAVMAEDIDKIIAAAADGTQLIFVEADLKKNTRLYKYFARSVDLHEDAKLNSNNLRSYINQELGGKISSQDAGFLLDRLAEDQQAITNAVQILKVHDSVDRQLISDLVEPAPKAKVFDLLDASSAGQIQKSLDIYQQLRDSGEDPFKIFGLIVWQLNIMVVAKVSSGDNESVAKANGVSAYALSKSQRAVGRISFADLKELVEDALRTSLSMKKDYVDPDAVVRIYIVQMGRCFSS